VVVLDDFSTGLRSNLEGLDLELIEHDVTQSFDVPCDQIYHLASTPYAAVRGASVVAVLNDEPVYRALNWRGIDGLTVRGAKVYACSAEISRAAAAQMKTFTLGAMA